VSLSFPALLECAGARPERGRRWRCGHCEGKSATLSVHPEKEVFFCHRCGWRGGRRSLERALGLATCTPAPAEIRERQLRRREAAEFVDWSRVKRIGLASLLRDLDKYEYRWREIGRQFAAGLPVSEDVFAKLQSLAAWQEKTEIQWKRFVDFEKHAGALYAEFASQGKAA
jgi:hypothetical protein